MRLLVSLAIAIGMVVASRASASPLFELTGDAIAQGGFSGRAAGASAASTYFNPALLTQAPVGVSLGLFLLNDQIGISLAGRKGGDVPLAYRGATHADGTVFERPSVPTQWLRAGCPAPECPLPLAARPRQSDGSSDDTRSYQGVGLVVAIVPQRVVLGFYGLVPLAKLTTAHSFFADEREQFFTNSLHPELYSDRLTATSLALGLGAQLAPGLSLGVGTTLSLRNTASAQSFVGNADDLARTLVLSTDVGVKVAFAPHFGLTFEPLDWLHLSATAHTEQRFDIESGISTFLPDGNEQMVWRRSVHDYMPLRVGLGVRFDILSDGRDDATGAHELALTATALLGFWSSYLDRQGEPPASDYAWSDTVSLVLGARYGFDHLRAFLDGSYVPSSVPPQTGRMNYVDGDRFGASAGIDYDFELFEIRFRAGAQGQLHVLPERTQIKTGSGPQSVRDELPDDAVDTRGNPVAGAAGLQTNNPGWPGFSSSGLLFGGGLSLTVLL